MRKNGTDIPFHFSLAKGKKRQGRKKRRKCIGGCVLWSISFRYRYLEIFEPYSAYFLFTMHVFSQENTYVHCKALDKQVYFSFAEASSTIMLANEVLS